MGRASPSVRGLAGGGAADASCAVLDELSELGNLWGVRKVDWKPVCRDSQRRAAAEEFPVGRAQLGQDIGAHASPPQANNVQAEQASSVTLGHAEWRYIQGDHGACTDHGEAANTGVLMNPSQSSKHGSVANLDVACERY